MTMLACGCIGTAVLAQDLGVTVSAILTVDSERVFNTTLAGRQITRDLEARLDRLVSENRRIEAELVAEELDLTERRSAMDQVAFRVLADAFDEKVQTIRAEQDAKQRSLQRAREADRQLFIDTIAPILSAIGRARGAVVILDRRNVLLSADNIDITEEAILRINATLGAEIPPDGGATEADTPDETLDQEVTPTSE
ncbi:MAG: OmpH family outer membrane protein [Paracoccaceae bacterium]